MKNIKGNKNGENLWQQEPEVTLMWILGNRTAHWEEMTLPTAWLLASCAGEVLSTDDLMHVTWTGAFNMHDTGWLLHSDSLPTLETGNTAESRTSTVTDYNTINAQYLHKT